MRAVLCKAFGPPETLVIENIPSPAPGPGQVRIAVHAAAVNLNDLLKLQGKHHEQRAVPFSPGSGIAGTVEALGAGVSGLAPGQRVLATMEHAAGGFAEEAVTAAALVTPMPPSMSFEVGCGFTGGVVTAAEAVLSVGETKPGDVVLVTGAGGGVGSAAVAMAKAAGATVIAVAGSSQRLDIARQAGADHLINHRTQDLREAVMRTTASRGANVVIEVVGGQMMRDALRCIAWRGRFVVTGFASFDVPEIRTILVLLKGFDLRGANLLLTAQKDPPAYRAICEQSVRWYSEGKIPVSIAATFALEDAAKALRFVEQGEHAGKVVLKVRQ